MAHSRYDCLASTCPAREVLTHVADKWTVLVLTVLTERTTRFNELRRRVQGITQKVLTQTLRDLERFGFVSRAIFAEVPPRVEYSLTPMGRSLVKVLEGVKDWAEAHAGEVVVARERFEKARAAASRRASGARLVSPRAA